MSNDSFDFDEFDSLAEQPTVTAWTSYVAPKGRTRKTYGRRGSTGFLTGHANTFSTSLPEEVNRFLSPTKEETEFGEIPSVPTFKPDAPTIRGRRRFTRANSLSTVSQSTLSMGPPSLRRSASVSGSVGSSSISSIRSSSISSNIDDSISELGENIHPNLNPLEEQVSPKRSFMIQDSRGRKKVRSSKSLVVLDSSALPPIPTLPTSSSFSNLAQNDVTSWAKPQQAAPESSPFPSSGPRPWTDLDMSVSSPAVSSIGSSRKRGICESPFEDFDDMLSTGGLSASRRTISRSRLMSPLDRSSQFNLDVTEPLNDFSMNSSSKKTNFQSMDVASDGDSGAEGDNNMDSDDEHSAEDKSLRRSPLPTFIPFEQRQARRTSMPTFPDAIPQVKALNPGTASDDDVIESMTSYVDLKFLVKRLRAERDVSHVNLCVPLPIEWKSKRRAEFIKWGTNSLGFKLFSGGGQVVYLQVSKSKGVGVLKLLESSLAECKKRGLGGKTPKNQGSSRKERFFSFDVTPKRQPPYIPAGQAAKTPKELTFNSVGRSAPDASDSLDDDLMNGMKFLGMKDRDYTRKQDHAAKPSIILEDDEEAFVEPRPSMDNHENSRDLMSHMGMTPVPHHRAPRLSVGSIAAAGTASKYAAASPFPHSTITSITKNSHGKSFCSEFMETPMAKPLDLGWGSCPVEGRDWGKSEQCEACILDELLLRLSQAQQEAGCYDLEEDEAGGPRPTALGLDMEAASNYRDRSDSPDSISNHIDGTGDDYFIGGEEASSPSSFGGSDRMDIVSESRPSSSFVTVQDSRALRRRQTSFAKHKRMSLFASAMNPASIFNARKSLFVRPPRASVVPKRSSLLANNIGSQHTFGVSIQSPMSNEVACESVANEWFDDDIILKRVLLYLSEPDLLRSASLVSTKWADVATEAHAELMLLSVGCKGFLSNPDDDEDDSDDEVDDDEAVQGMLERPWSYLTTTFPWARFLAEGGFKQVYKVFNHKHRVEEAISVMDIDMLKHAGEMNVVGAELAVSVMLSSLVRRGVCPNFVMTRGAFSCPFKPPASLWGSEKNKCPKGNVYESPKLKKKPKEPKRKGRYQYIRMELCDGGDAEEFLKTLSDEVLPIEQSRQLLFQMAFALHAAAHRCSLKHYDVKLLNYFVQSMKSEKEGDVVLRYGLGQHTFALRTPSELALMAKLADYGTANVDSSTNGQQVTIAQFTTLENTPIDFMILGDRASQGHGHDNFGLGLCMLHLFTGHAPYEEILEDVFCPKNLKERLRDIWECEDEHEFSVIRSVILSDVDKDEEGHIIEGEPNEILYHTFYRFLVLFGLPDLPSNLSNSKVWISVKECLEGGQTRRKTSKSKKKRGNDISRYTRDCKKFSLSHGNNRYIARAREGLSKMDGGMELLLSLVSFDPSLRYTALDVMNSPFMEPLREPAGGIELYGEEDDVRTYTSFSTQY